MNCLVLGGTKFFGKHLVRTLIENGHHVTIATRGKTPDPFGADVGRILTDRADCDKMKNSFAGKIYDVVFDDLAYCSLDVKYALEAVQCGRYIMVSSAAVYDLHPNTTEEDFLPHQKELIWSGRKDFPYGENKRLAECALFQAYQTQNAVAVRFPFVLGEDDYTKRLSAYITSQLSGIPMYVDDVDAQMSLIRSDEAGKFLAYLADQELQGSVNACSAGTVSVREITDYIEKKTGKKALFTADGEEAPYNGTGTYSLNTEKAESTGFHFTELKDWIYHLIDFEIGKI